MGAEDLFLQDFSLDPTEWIRTFPLKNIKVERVHDIIS